MRAHHLFFGIVTAPAQGLVYHRAFEMAGYRLLLSGFRFATHCLTYLVPLLIWFISMAAEIGRE